MKVLQLLARFRVYPAEKRSHAGCDASGFTLIELMIVVAIIAILSMVAYPAYQDSVWKGKRGEGKAALFRALQSEERYYTSNNTYIDSTSPNISTAAIPTFSGDSPSKSIYAISASTCPNTTFLIDQCVAVTATTQGTTDPKCGSTLTMTSRGVKTSAIADPVCW